MIAYLLSGCLLSLDSLVVSLALGPLFQSWTQRWRFAALLGTCDGLATLVGCSFGWNGWIGFDRRVVPLVILTFGIYYLVAARWDKFRSDLRLVFALPVLMSFDNLTYCAINRLST